MATQERDYEQVSYETAAPGVARIIMDRASRCNAQGITMTYELDKALRRACHDDAIKVVILAGAGDHWNAGHDVSGDGPANPPPDQIVGLCGCFGGKGWEGPYCREREIYLEITERWRNAPKPVIAEIQGSVISGGLMLAWMCDLIMCADDARFRDATAAEMGIPGVEFFQHPYEMTIRQAKEWLMTGGWISAEEALRRGMVNHVVPRDELAQRTLELAEGLAAANPFTVKLAKQAMNFAQDRAGRRASMDFAFHLHQMGHLQAMLTNGVPVDVHSLPPMIRANLEKVMAARRAASAR